MNNSKFDLGPPQLWAAPRGLDVYFQNLIQFMDRHFLEEFFTWAESIDHLLPRGEERNRFEQEFARLQNVPIHFIRFVLSHPVWIYRVRHYRDLLRDNHSSFVQSLNVFSDLVLAAHMLAGKEIEIKIHFERYPYFSLPGTGLSHLLSPSWQGAKADATIVSHQNGFCTLMLRRQQERSDLNYINKNYHIQPFYCAENNSNHWLSVSNGFLELDARDMTFVQNWIPTDPAAEAIIPEWQKQLDGCLALLQECFPRIYQEMRLVLRTIVPVSSLNEAFISCSSRKFWGAIQCSPHPGIMLCETLVHEYRHIILNAILEVDPVLDASTPNQAIFYSPWRPDPRPLRGILHGIYSFMEVVAFYQAYLERFGLNAPQAQYAQNEIMANSCRLHIACKELYKHAKLTPFGVQFLEAIQSRVDEIKKYAESLDPSSFHSFADQFEVEYSTHIAAV